MVKADLAQGRGAGMRGVADDGDAAAAQRPARHNFPGTTKAPCIQALTR